MGLLLWWCGCLLLYCCHWKLYMYDMVTIHIMINMTWLRMFMIKKYFGTILALFHIQELQKQYQSYHATMPMIQNGLIYIFCSLLTGPGLYSQRYLTFLKPNVMLMQTIELLYQIQPALQLVSTLEPVCPYYHVDHRCIKESKLCEFLQSRI